MTFNLKTLPITANKADIEWSDILFGAASQAAAAPEPFGLAALRDKFDDHIRRTGSKTANDPFAIEQTWNNASVVFSALKVDVTDTASHSDSTLLELLRGGSAIFTVGSQQGAYLAAGSIGSPALRIGDSIGPANNLGLYRRAQGRFTFGDTNSVNLLEIANISGRALLALNNTGSLVWTSAGADYAADTILQRNGVAGVLALHGLETNSAALEIYKTANAIPSPTNHERAMLRWNGDVFEVGTEAGGTGTRRNVRLNGANRASKINDPAGGSTQDTEGRAAISSIIDVLESHGLSATA